MVIVWSSLGLVLLAIIWFIIQVISGAKKMKSTIVEVSKKAEQLRKDSESIIKHQERLQDTASALLEDIDEKKQAIQFTQQQTHQFIRQVQDSKERVTQAFKFKGIEKYKI
ncbi:uncharacterized protein YoxC [Pullulanibacillus pueri]|uniref:DUF948 domain-containing protein n=1 Tax=Pullulanibacillus pueri TaxID=1437324 RepID=A0A8J2ZZ11_9BACL|nr:hypothetical protein [Pullulanibacillus pueri]MBM7680528.1 uncharacterized protein YoxC [Pullulanibacillus pueri]GGH86124.1 hypothetical protein GCM10007096_33100 [Pullulanibacillus pueri]